MLTTVIRFCLLAALSAPVIGQDQGLKVFISVDMEGLAGVAQSSDVNSSGRDYEHFRKLMAAETKAAIDGAWAAGATQIVVRDSHGSKTNLLPGDLPANVKLLRGATDHPKNMMLGIDESFDAVVFIGYHARAGTPDAILEHTSNGNVLDMQINGVSMPEAGYNALIAGLYDVPVAFIAGDKAFVEQAREILGDVAAVSVKEEIEGAVLGTAPETACQLIALGVEGGLRDLASTQPYKMTPPYTLLLKVRREGDQLYPGAERLGDGQFRFTSEDLLEVLDAFNAMK